MRYLPWTFAVATVATLGVGSLVLKSHIVEARNGQHGEQAALVDAFPAERSLHQSYLEVSGVVTAPQSLALVNELAGKISKIAMHSGEMVTQGDILLEIDHAEELAQLKAAKANLSQQINRVQRFTQLHASEKLSAQQLEEAQAQQAQFAAQVELLQVQIDKKILRAPFTGQVGIHNLQLGQFLPANTNITQLIGVASEVWIDFALPQSYPVLGKETAIEVLNIGSSQQAITGEIVSVAAEVSKQTRQLSYRATVDNANLAINQLVKVRVPVGAAESVFSVSHLAVIKDPLGDFVYALEADEHNTLRAVRLPVTLGERIGDQVLVLSGISEGMLIAGSGAFKLRQGLKTFVSDAEPVTVASQVQSIGEQAL
ncbi:efflux RND transporter periplasmic adaptor subunit [Pseudoalteromonas fenneropenaei]|uniref:Efflux RND transporter periplasmic adaptor subunit n=1 Tax=Pseudoalteromonas fenneropenaei TaxID=1737459 RepID=A0ABV7CM50_9GAMM